MRAKVVIIEDERDIGEALAFSLTNDGCKVWNETDGRRGLELVRKIAPDVLLLDLMLPSLHGHEVCRAVKSDPILSGTSIIMLTARTEESDVLLGLGLGADDYVTKPFRTRELIARVQAVLRRGHLRGDGGTGLVRVGEVAIDAASHEVYVGERKVQLTATEFRLLRFLASHPGRVFARDELLTHVIGHHAVVIDRNIDVHVRSIRRKLGTEVEIIETIRGVGYRLITPLKS